MQFKNLVIATLCILTLVGCSSENEGGPVVNNQNKSDLVSDLTSFNNSLKAQYLARGNSLVIDNGNPQILNDAHWSDIVLEDVEGFLTGWSIGFILGPKGGVLVGTLYGVGKSAVKYYGTCKQKMPNHTKLSNGIEEIVQSGEIKDTEFMYKAYLLTGRKKARATTKKPINIQVSDSLFKTSEKMAIAHNDIIGLFENKSSISEIRAIKISKDDAQFAIINTPEFKMAYAKYIDDAINNKGTNLIDSADKVKKDQVLKLYYDAIAMCPDKAHDIAFIVNIYVEKIYQSNELSEKERAEIYPGIAGGAYSSVFWEEERAKISLAN